MKTFGGPAVFLDKDNINTDEIIPAKYLTEISKTALKTHLLEDLILATKRFDHHSQKMQSGQVIITRANFGCGSSREHAVWAFEVNNINVIIAENFARIFRQNMFNCGLLAIELEKVQIDELLNMVGNITISIDLPKCELSAASDSTSQGSLTFQFDLNAFDKKLVSEGVWFSYADSNY